MESAAAIKPGIITTTDFQYITSKKPMISTFEELKLIALCVAADNRDAFGQLVEAYDESLRRFLLTLTSNDASLTDDLAQETFLKAYLSIRSFRGISKFRTWLFRIAYNEFVSYRRRYGAESNRLIGSDCIEEPYDQHSPTDAKIDVERLIASLPEKERAIVLLFYIEDMPIKKISEITGDPEGSIKSMLSRSREKMKLLIQI